jgi:hypothetical protein
MKFILNIAMILGGVSLLAQVNYDQRLLAKFSETQIEELQEKSPHVLAYWTFYVNNAYEIVPMPAGKDGNDLEVIEYTEGEFNILTSGLHMERSAPQYFRIENSDQVLRLRSSEELVARFNESK